MFPKVIDEIILLYNLPIRRVKREERRRKKRRRRNTKMKKICDT